MYGGVGGGIKEETETETVPRGEGGSLKSMMLEPTRGLTATLDHGRLGEIRHLVGLETRSLCLISGEHSCMMANEADPGELEVH